MRTCVDWNFLDIYVFAHGNRIWRADGFWGGNKVTPLLSWRPSMGVNTATRGVDCLTFGATRSIQIVRRLYRKQHKLSPWSFPNFNSFKRVIQTIQENHSGDTTPRPWTPPRQRDGVTRMIFLKPLDYTFKTVVIWNRPWWESVLFPVKPSYLLSECSSWHQMSEIIHPSCCGVYTHTSDGRHENRGVTLFPPHKPSARQMRLPWAKT